MKFDFKKFRENYLHMSISETAQFFNLRNDRIIKYEKNSEEITVELYLKLAKLLGVSLDLLLNYESPSIKQLEYDGNWDEVEKTKQAIIDQFNNRKFRFFEEKIENFKKRIHYISKKPKVGFLGTSLTGKTSIINSFLGENIAFNTFDKRTSLITCYKHINDKPDFFKDDFIIFDTNFQLEDLTTINEDFFKKHGLISGKYTDLYNYTTNQGEHCYKNQETAIVFYDAPILKGCDLVDFPALTDTKDYSYDTNIFDVKQKCDIIVYVANALQSLTVRDCQYLSNILTTLTLVENKENEIMEPLSNLFILANKIDLSESTENNSFNEVTEKFAKNLNKIISTNFWERREILTEYKYDFEILKNRIFPYSFVDKKFNSYFEEAFIKTVKIFPKLIINRIELFKIKISKYMESQIKSELNTLDNLKNNRENFILFIEKLKASVENENNFKYLNDIFDIIDLQKDKIYKSFLKNSEKFITNSVFKETIAEKDYEGTEDDFFKLATNVSNSIFGLLQEVLKEPTELISKNVNYLLSIFIKNNLPNEYKKSYIPINYFIPKTEFLSELNKSSKIGALISLSSPTFNFLKYYSKDNDLKVSNSFLLTNSEIKAIDASIINLLSYYIIDLQMEAYKYLGNFVTYGYYWNSYFARRTFDFFKSEKAEKIITNVIDSFFDDLIKSIKIAFNSLHTKWNKFITNIDLSNDNYETLIKELNTANEFFNNLNK